MRPALGARHALLQRIGGHEALSVELRRDAGAAIAVDGLRAGDGHVQLLLLPGHDLLLMQRLRLGGGAELPRRDESGRNRKLHPHVSGCRLDVRRKSSHHDDGASHATAVSPRA